MQQAPVPKVYEELGLKQVICAANAVTVLGGSSFPPKILEAIDDANKIYVNMQDLLDKTGQAIADLLGAEAAHVTSGCAAAVALGAAGMMTGTDRDRIGRLPDTSGFKNEFLIQNRMRHHYERCVEASGAKLKHVGDDDGTTTDQIVDAIGPDTVGIAYAAHIEGTEGTLALSEVVDIAKDKGLYVLVDASYQLYPLERTTELVNSGADVVCFGAKYMGGPNSAGFLCGSKEMVYAAALNGFMAYEMEDVHSFGRGYKLDRQEIIATLLTLKDWRAMDHDARLRSQERRFQVVQEALGGLPHLRTEQDFYARYPSMEMKVFLDEAALGKTAEQVEDELKAGDPSIWVWREENAIKLGMDCLDEGEEHIVAWRLRELLQS